MDNNQHYRNYGKAKGITGDVLEIGLGEGIIAQTLVEKKDVNTVTNYEIDDAVSDKFGADHPKFHAKHTLKRGDYLKDKSNKKKYDIGIVDLFYTREHYAYVKDIVKKLKTNIKKGGKIMIEYQGDFPEERDFRAFMEAETGPMVSEHINTGIKATSTHVCYYEVK